MAFRSQAYLKSMINSLSGRVSMYGTSTLPNLKSYVPSAAATDKPLKQSLPRGKKGDLVPVYVAIAMIALSTSFGLHTAMHQLKRAPNVFVKKCRRETLPELVEPEHVAEESDQFLNKSFFRKVAHIQPTAAHDPLGCVYTRHPRVETLKSVGVEPMP
ncbi:PREDICTED: uncharacterized protein LOC109164684 [Ipomoea nil]|uniref:uncharacterized protein LOC109164684 n=1 Tax=Ipomoea nil TaxID=35883 RepID=UPI0009015B50|nr:PREDICTED: uncharacterized protein LOC109164684 [Ipomoea nil]XP_019168761.1 PREDICTED: uncharacterized protein LOC109164684 [Ipomoea nil]XP_019168762.1 PREDICTED: uncharacterized protein LOC109164684 [Ipomoea nil]